MRAASRAPTGHDSGAVTIEAAIALCGFVTVLAMAFAGVAAVFDQIRCTDAAREAARLVARGEDGRVAEAVNKIGPSGAQYSVRLSGDTLVVEVRAEPANGLLPGVHVSADAYGVREPSGDQTDPTAPPPPGGP